MTSNTVTFGFRPAMGAGGAGRAGRAGLPALCIAALLAACGPGGQSSGGPTNARILPLGGAPVATAVVPGNDAVGQTGDRPEGAPGLGIGLARLGEAALSLGETGGAVPPPDAVRKIDGVPVALLAPLTGRLEGAGRALLEGAQMALFDVGNPEFRLLPLDTGGSVAGAESAAREAVRQGARLIVGPLLADNVQAIRPIVEGAGIQSVAFSNSSRVADPPVYLAGFTPEEQVAAIVSHAAGEGRMKFAVLAPSNDYGRVAVDALRAATDAQGVEFAGIGFYDPGALDLAQPIQTLSNYAERVKALADQRQQLRDQGDQAALQALKRLEVLDTFGDPPFDALLLPVLDVQTLQILSAQLSFYDVDQPSVMLLGLQRWDSFAALTNEPGLLGSRYPAARSVHKPRFTARFTEFFGHKPSDLSALAYDVTAIAAALAGDGQGLPRYDDDTLTDPQGFLGIEGLFRFMPDGTAQRGFAILEVRQTGPAIVAPAPLRFPDQVPSS